MRENPNVPIELRLPGSDETWPLPENWTDAELRFAWNVAREEDKELRVELGSSDGTVTHLIIYPRLTPWYEIRGAPKPE